MTPQRYRKLRRVLDTRQPDLTVLMDNVHKEHNFSAVLRTCDAVGVLEAHGVWPNPRYQPARGVSAGSGKWVRVHTHPRLEAAIAHLRERGLQVLAATTSPRSVDFRNVDYTRPTAVLVGAELTGVSDAGRALADAHVEIPMAGFVESLNVSVATAVVLYEAQRQRAAAGMYAAPRLADADYQRLLFEWGHPRLARRCRTLGVPYPPLGPDGDPASASA